MKVEDMKSVLGFLCICGCVLKVTCVLSRWQTENGLLNSSSNGNLHGEEGSMHFHNFLPDLSVLVVMMFLL